VNHQKSAPLSRNLSEVRCFFKDDDTDKSEADLHLKFFLGIRHDLGFFQSHYQYLFSKDPGLPPLQHRTFCDRLSFWLAAKCHLCGAVFGSLKTNPITMRRYRVVKNTGKSCFSYPIVFSALFGGVEKQICFFKHGN
jgi:hypothetical protein